MYSRDGNTCWSSSSSPSIVFDASAVDANTEDGEDDDDAVMAFDVKLVIGDAGIHCCSCD